VTIRRADSSDLERLLPLAAGYREFYERRPDPAGERAFFERHLRDGSSVLFIAEEEGEVIGFTQLFASFSTVHLGPSFVLEDVYVIPNARNRGVGGALLDAALAFARENGAVGMSLETAATNQTAQRTYERCGWHREQRFVKYNAPL
jgi:ribosomal protein S18 acetylase RimI-like enzyme